MINNKMADAINRLRGVSPSVPAPNPKKETKMQTSPESTAAPTASAEDQAAFNNLMAKAPVDNTPEADKKYTMEDLNNFLAKIIGE